MTPKEPNKPKLSLTPPEKNQKKFRAIKEFINAATYTTRSDTEEPVIERSLYPWEEPQVRLDVTKIFNVRLPEPYSLKLDFLALRTRKSKQQLCLEALLKAIDEQVQVYIKKDQTRQKRG